MRKFHYCITNLFPLFDSLMKTVKLTEKVGQTVFNLSFVGQLNWNVLTPFVLITSECINKIVRCVGLVLLFHWLFPPPPPPHFSSMASFPPLMARIHFSCSFPSFLVMFIHDVRGSRCTLFSAWHQKRWSLHDANLLMCQKKGEFLLFGPFAAMPYWIQQK